MGIYIAGMELPKDGRKHNALLQFLEDGKCRAIVDYSKAYDDRDVKVFEVVPIPPHGRLIDADTCEDFFYEHLSDAGMVGAKNAIDEMPTIIPAEEE